MKPRKEKSESVSCTEAHHSSLSMLFWVRGIVFLNVSAAVRGFTNKTIIFATAVFIILSGYYLALVPGLPRSIYI